MNKLLLVAPDEIFAESFFDYVKEFNDNNEANLSLYWDAVNDFPQYLQTLRDHALGLNLPEGWVPCHTYWLVDESKCILGVIRIRTTIATEFLTKFAGHIGYDIRPSMRKRGYGKQLLQLGLVKAKELGLEKILITCAVDNLASQKIIEANGGKYESQVYHETNAEMLNRYWIEL